MNKKHFIFLGVLLLSVMVGIVCVLAGCQSHEQVNEELTTTTTNKDTLILDFVGDTATEDVNSTDQAMGVEEKVYHLPKYMSFRSGTLNEAMRAGNTLDVRVTATVRPSNATRREVDYSVSWGNGAEHANDPVTDYVSVRQDADGSPYATISCKKSFDDDKIIVTVTTRDGGFTDTCTITFLGIATEMDIRPDSVSPTYSDARGIYYEIGTNSSASFSVDLDNIFHDVGAKNYTVTLGGVGGLYYGTRCYSYDSFVTSYKNMSIITMGDLVPRLASARISGNTLTVNVASKDAVTYTYGTSRDELNGVDYTYERYVEDDFVYCSGEWETNARFNEQNLDKCYFTVTVTDTVSNVSHTIKFWIVTSVTGVDLNNDQLTF